MQFYICFDCRVVHSVKQMSAEATVIEAEKKAEEMSKKDLEGDLFTLNEKIELLKKQASFVIFI